MLTLKQVLPTLVLVRGSLFLYEDEPLLAIPSDTTSTPVPTILEKKEIKECQKYAKTYCCQKRIFTFNKKPCYHQLLDSSLPPNRECMHKFTLLDSRNLFVISKPQNIFDLYIRGFESGTFHCPRNPPHSFTLSYLQEIKIPPG